MSAGVKKAKKRAAALRRAANQGKRKRLWGGQGRYMSWKHLTCNQKEVARRLARGEEKVLLTSLDVNRPRDVIDRYDLRSLIENCGNRDLKSRQRRDST